MKTETRPDTLNLAPAVTRAYMHGLTAGLVGAVALMGTFLVIDAARGQILTTPTLMGSLLFRGQMPPAGAVDATLVAAYSVFHLGAFAALGILAEVLMRGFSEARRLGAGAVALGALALFTVQQALVALLAGLLEPALLTQLGTFEVAVANAIAATAISISLAWHRA
ncbi:MAG: hypothetical protein H6736_08590 [Alphaproteobacteria bacterium]|nr:hypothetical protein [Alphaproteobacteria bacterium]MCB9691859.1 hypothetical protein [Alphaproteobacteria bacterium]